MANANPYQARLARKRPTPPGTIADLTEVLWHAITRLEDHMTEVSDTGELCKLTHAISQAGGPT